MPRRPRLALFFSGLFFGGGLDHTIFIAMGSSTSHSRAWLNRMGLIVLFSAVPSSVSAQTAAPAQTMRESDSLINGALIGASWA